VITYFCATIPHCQIARQLSWHIDEVYYHILHHICIACVQFSLRLDDTHRHSTLVAHCKYHYLKGYLYFHLSTFWSTVTGRFCKVDHCYHRFGEYRNKTVSNLTYEFAVKHIIWINKIFFKRKCYFQLYCTVLLLRQEYFLDLW